MKRTIESSQLYSVGDPQRFGIECELFPPEVYNGHHYPVGILYLWAGGHRLGHAHMDCALHVPAGTLLNQWRRKGTLSDPRLDGRPALEAFRVFRQARYGDGAPDADNYSRWARLEVCPLGEQAHDGWIAILLEEATQDRFIWENPELQVHELILSRGEFHQVAFRFVEWLASHSSWFERHYNAHRDPIPVGK